MGAVTSTDNHLLHLNPALLPIVHTLYRRHSLHRRGQETLLYGLVVAVASPLRPICTQPARLGTTPATQCRIEARQDLLELLAKILVEPGVQERVVARGRHGHRVGHEEAQEVESPVHGGYVEVVENVDQIQRQPRDTEYGNHRYQHSVGAPLPVAICFFLAHVLTARFGLGSVVQFEADAGVAKSDDDKRQNELHSSGQTPVDLSRLFRGPSFFAVSDISLLLQLHVPTVRESYTQRERPNEEDDSYAGGQLHSRMERVYDDEEPVDGYGSQGEGGYVDTAPLSVGHDVTEQLAEDPPAHEGVQWCERHRE